MLVDKLPIGSKLTAVFDSCHSGTLLDLDHYLCNEVYQSFLSRPPGQQKSKWMDVSEYRMNWHCSICLLSAHHAGRKNADSELECSEAGKNTDV